MVALRFGMDPEKVKDLPLELYLEMREAVAEDQARQAALAQVAGMRRR